MREEIKVHVVDYGRKNLYMRYADPVTRKQVSRSTGKNKKREAEREAAKWEAELQEGRYKAASKVTWEEFRELYEIEYLPNLTERSAEKALQVFDEVKRMMNFKRLSSLNSERVTAYQNELRKRGNTDSTIKGKLAYLKAALNWAKNKKILAEVPDFQMPKKAKNSRVMKGRPITGEEFDRMLLAVKNEVLSEKRLEELEEQADIDPLVDSWKHLLRGLWWSGLRLGEALELTWDNHNKLRIDLSGTHPMMHIPAELEKGGRDRVLPIAPEFAEMILATPAPQRNGFMFSVDAERRFTKEHVGKVISRIGKKAGVVVSTKGGKTKYASAHDLRRAFGTRWSGRVMPAILQQLMRHESIDTTMKFYVEQEAEATAEILYSAVSQKNLNRFFRDTV